MTLHTPFGKLQLRPTVGAGSGQHLLHAAEDHLLTPASRLTHRLGYHRSQLTLADARRAG
jgi:hypothetical protein